MPEPLRLGFVGHKITTVGEAGFKGLKNGALLAVAADNFDVLVTVDKGFEYQQNLKSLPLAILLIRARTNDIDDLETLLPDALEALKTISAREFKKISKQ
ncbi:MAG: DUF5615 family PIN-like protein [Pyrinomonadaceae bacterium]